MVYVFFHTVHFKSLLLIVEMSYLTGECGMTRWNEKVRRGVYKRFDGA